MLVFQKVKKIDKLLISVVCGESMENIKISVYDFFYVFKIGIQWTVVKKVLGIKISFFARMLFAFIWNII